MARLQKRPRPAPDTPAPRQLRDAQSSRTPPAPPWSSSTRGRVERIPYELCVLVALRDALRWREIWVPGANWWQNLEDDLPPDFEDNCDVHYDAIRQPQDPEKFFEALQKRLREALTRFDTALELGTTGGVDIVKKHGEPWTALVHVNTLLLQDIRSEEKWQKRLTDADRRALSPAVLDTREPLRPVRAGHELPPRPRRRGSGHW